LQLMLKMRHQQFPPATVSRRPSLHALIPDYWDRRNKLQQRACRAHHVSALWLGDRIHGRVAFTGRVCIKGQWPRLQKERRHWQGKDAKRSKFRAKEVAFAHSGSIALLAAHGLDGWLISSLEAPFSFPTLGEEERQRSVVVLLHATLAGAATVTGRMSAGG
jgi:hypothetical protein